MSLADKFHRVRSLWADLRSIGAMRHEIELLRSRVDCDPALFSLLEAERQSDAYSARYAAKEPLVSICIATYNRGELVCERAIRSLLSQTYQNVEVIVVGDGCTDDTEERVSKIRDSRLRFVNLAQRGVYPEDRHRRWCVAGGTPLNVGLEMANGDFISHLDDDDRHLPERVERLLRHAQRERLEVVFHPFKTEQQDGSWTVNAADSFSYGRVTTSSLFYDRFFTRIPLDLNAHLLNEPGDWNRLRKFAYLGARIGRYPDPLLEHFRERNQRS